ncbi:UDP-glucosyltransferase 2-like [Ostrinia nubilalis]|uniref:UDP-glucosyltransferase 2-like n=1 Tax=Ostrinia nubilalis TaxID=29057 RepID=UPI003082668F
MHFNLLAFILWLLALAYTANPIKILGIFPYDRKSHFIVFKVLLQELARRGHDVTIISHFPEENPPKNYHDISLFIPKESKSRRRRSASTLERSYLNVIKGGIYLTRGGNENCKVLVANEEVQGLINRTEYYDVALIEQFNSDCALGLAYKLSAPVVGVTTHVLMPWHYKRFGVPYNPSYTSFRFLEGGTKPTLYQRVERAVFDVYFKLLYYYIAQRADERTLAEYYDDIPPLENLARDIKFLLLDQHFVLTGSSLYPPNVIEIGGFHVPKPNRLSGDLKNFVEEAEHGVIYISFGTTVRLSLMTLQKLEAILDAIEILPQRFIWRWSKEASLTMEPFNQLGPKHLALLADKNKTYIRNWLPQVDILSHPKVLAFFSHAGMGGTTEAIHFGVPVVAMPIAGDQPANAAAIEESGFGVQQPVNELTKETLISNFRKVLEPEFREKVKLRSKAWHDRPLSPMDAAVYWIEYAARNRNFTLRTPAADVPLYQYINLDIALVVAAFVTGVTLLIIALRLSIKSMTKKPLSDKKRM